MFLQKASVKQFIRNSKISEFIFLLAILLISCDSRPSITLKDIPVFTGAIALEPNESSLTTILAENMEQDKKLHIKLNMTGDIEQSAYRLTLNTSWKDVEDFYSQKLEEDTWSKGTEFLGNYLMSDAMRYINASNSLFQTATWTGYDVYHLTVVRFVDPLDENNVFLILSLSED